MTVVSIVATKGGIGQTTVVASLATALARRLGPNHVAALDLAATQALRWHLGADQEDPTDPSETVARTGAHAHRSSTGVAYLRRPGTTAAPNTASASDTRWLADLSRGHGLAENAIVLVDTCVRDPKTRARTLRNSDLTLAVVAPDAACYATLVAQDRVLALCPGAHRSRIVVNGYDPRDRLAMDIVRRLEDQYEERLAPVMIHQDEGVREALALGQTCLTYDPYSQASHDLDQLGQWLLTTLEQDLGL